MSRALSYLIFILTLIVHPGRAVFKRLRTAPSNKLPVNVTVDPADLSDLPGYDIQLKKTVSEDESAVQSTSPELRPSHAARPSHVGRVNPAKKRHATNPTHNGKQAPLREAVVVTLHKLTPGVLALFTNLKKSLAGGTRALWALVDSSRATTTMLQTIGRHIGNQQHVVTVNYQMMLHKFFPNPNLQQRRSFDTFEGIHQSPAKPGALWFLAEGPGTWYEFVWVLEADVRLHWGNWLPFFDYYGQRRSDLIALVNEQGKRWSHWRGCNHPGCKKIRTRQQSFLPIFRLSKRLAADVLGTLRGGYTGHHEAFVHAVCDHEWRWHCVSEDLGHSPFYGYITYRKPLPKQLTPGKVYHPIKNFHADTVRSGE